MPKYIFNLTLEGVILADSWQDAWEKLVKAAKELEYNTVEGEPQMTELKIDSIYPGLHVPVSPQV